MVKSFWPSDHVAFLKTLPELSRDLRSHRDAGVRLDIADAGDVLARPAA
jgi:hypothetical protein